jgi:hypothetical protein
MANKFTKLNIGDAVASSGGRAWKKLSAESGGGLPAVGTSLEDCTWEQISAISAAGKAEEYFKVGDTKSVYLKGTVGTIELDTTLYVYILGFNHNSEIEGEGITFGTFKTVDGRDVALVDSKYSTSSSDGTKYFNMNHSGNTSSGGWQGCDMRYDILGSVDVNDAQYASETTATDPVANTLMAALPADLRAVMKPMTIYSDNTGGGSNTASYVTVTTDYLPLLAEFEIFGTRSGANSAEQNYQEQYAYFVAGNSKVKYRHSSPGSTAIWWLRSVSSDGSAFFRGVNTSGTRHTAPVLYAYGVAPIFKV